MSLKKVRIVYLKKHNRFAQWKIKGGYFPGKFLFARSGNNEDMKMEEDAYKFFLHIYEMVKDDDFCVHLLKKITLDEKYSGEDFLKEYEKRNGGL